MRRTTLLVVITAWVASLVAVATMAGAQGRGWSAVEPTVFSGEDVAVRIDWMKDGVPYGTLMVRVRGDWQDVQLGHPPNVVIRPSPPEMPAPPPRQ